MMLYYNIFDDYIILPRKETYILLLIIYNIVATTTVTYKIQIVDPVSFVIVSYSSNNKIEHLTH